MSVYGYGSKIGDTRYVSFGFPQNDLLLDALNFEPQPRQELSVCALGLGRPNPNLM